MEFLNLILIFFTCILFQKGQETYAIPMNKISIEELKLLEYEIKNSTKNNALKSQASCSKTEDCYNAGVCGPDGMCFCAPGYKGDKCEKIIGCDELYCNPEISDCILKEETGEGMCHCKEKGKQYFHHKCVGSCKDDHECKHNGVCGPKNVCGCKGGTEGDYCEIIKNCEELNCDTKISDCIFDHVTEKGMCKCKEESKLYIENKCVAPCSKDDCYNGGVCSEDGVCLCASGYKGNKCERIIACDALDCNPEISDCKLNVETNLGECQCKEIGKQYFRNICVGSCNDDSECKNGGECGSRNVCRCKVGTKGDYCETVTGCEELNCDTEISVCVLDETTAKGMCKCKEKGKVYVDGKCVATCKVKKDCQNEADCVKPRGASFRFCRCKSPFEGDFCEIVKECKLVRYANCKGGNGTCVYSKEAKRAICKCGEKKELDVSVTYCKDCYCGENGKCTITNDVKTCICNPNYTEGSDGICHAECKSDADCKNGGTCSRNVCHCTNSTSGDDCGVISGCDELNCEHINARCTFNILNKVATCTCRDSNRVYVNNECMECQCGKHSTSCMFDQQGKKICECKNGYSPRNGTCTDNTITDTRKEIMVYSIQREFKQNEVFKFYALPS